MTGQKRMQLYRMLQGSRHRLKRLCPEFEALFETVHIAAVKDVWHISTNGDCVVLDPAWLGKLGSRGLDFILGHVLMHILLGHIHRPKYYAGDRFHLAADIVVNSHLELFDWKYEKISGVGRIFSETFYPAEQGRYLTALEAMDGVPFDPAGMSPGMRRSYMIDSEEYWDRQNEGAFCGEMLLTPDDPDEPWEESEEGAKLNVHLNIRREFEKIIGEDEEPAEKDENIGEENTEREAVPWEKQVMRELRRLREEQRRETSRDEDGRFTERLWQKAGSGSLNWRKLLSSFVQEEVFDYSFSPPDRRLQDPDLFLPDFNVRREFPRPVLFFADTSASVEDEMLFAVYGELCSAIKQFGGGLSGKLGFFDTRVYPPRPFSDSAELGQIPPCGGGGTDYGCVFRYAASMEETPCSIVIFTDGDGGYPPVTAAMNIPVLWIFTRETEPPPWGQWAVMKQP